MLPCFATTVRGLEQLLADELTTFGAREINLVNAGLEFVADFEAIMQMNLHSRLASRIMLRVAATGYRTEEDIYRLARKVEWSKWFNSGDSIKVATSAIGCPLKSLDFVTLRVKDAICDYFVEQVDSRPSVDKAAPDMRIYTFLTEESVTIYVDTSGETLFKRGYRKAKLEAPIRENLAFGLIKLSGWSPDQPFYDPMCGSGTIVIEAVCYGLNIAPGLNRNFAFEKFTTFNEAAWFKFKAAAVAAINYHQPLQIYASDISRNAIEIAKQNLQQIKLDQYVHFSSGDVLDKTAPAATGVLITNPPYGIRLDEQEHLATVYPLLAKVLKNSFAGWRCCFFTADLRMPKLFRLKPSRKIPLYNGALECRFYEFKMVSGSNRS